MQHFCCEISEIWESRRFWSIDVWSGCALNYCFFLFPSFLSLACVHWTIDWFYFVKNVEIPEIHQHWSMLDNICKNKWNFENRSATMRKCLTTFSWLFEFGAVQKCEALFMVFRLESKGANVCKYSRSCQENSHEYLLVLFTCKHLLRYSQERAP